MHPNITSLLQKHSLLRYAKLIENSMEPAVGFMLSHSEDDLPVASSRAGGYPDLPPNFKWPMNKGRPLDYLLQINLSNVVQFKHPKMPIEGLLTFFYDLENQPWGFDPADLKGYHVAYHPSLGDLKRIVELPIEEFRFPESTMKFFHLETLPHYDSQSCNELLGNMPQDDSEEDTYYEFVEEYERLFSDADTSHRLFGHASNIQGDMQLEAQLVMSGLYCGNETGYEDPRVEALAEDAQDWQLLLQVDSDDRLEMWGDCGMLYYWIRRHDLSIGAFDRVWVTIQCY